MADRPLVSMAQQFTGLPMEALIGGPLNAAAKANAAMAVTQTKFILDTCFTKYTPTPDPNAPAPSDPNDPGKSSTAYKPIMIAMTLTRGVITPQEQTKPTEQEPNPPPVPPIITPVETKFDLPLITIIPINSLGVDDVSITFEMEVKSSFSEEQTDQKETEIKASVEWEVKVGYGPFSASVKGNASYDHKDSSTHSTHYQKSNSAKYTVNVHAGQLPVPKGVNTIIEAYTRAIQPIILPTEGGKPAQGG